jgi:exonuclease SbcC
MLIRSLRLINFKKYSKIVIDDLPQRGVVKVGGKNETGKTSIGDAVCFALFGRTLLNNQKNAKRLIRWGQHKMSVVLVLENDKNEAFEITRTIDEKTPNSIRIVRLSDQYTLTNSIEESDKTISDLLGYGYDTFIDSFCMVQRELSIPDVNSTSIKQMAGLGDYASISDSLAREREEEELALVALKPRYDDKNTALDTIKLDESWLPELIDGKESLLANREDKQQLAAQLGELHTSYPESRQQFKQVSRQHDVFEGLSVFLLPLMFGAWLVWGAFQFFPEMVQKWLPNSTSSHHADSFILWVQTWMFPFAMGCVLLFSISLVLKWLAEAKMNTLSDQAETFSSLLSQGHQEVISEPNSIVPARVALLLFDKYKSRDGRDVSLLAIPPTDKFNHIPQLANTFSNYSATPSEMEVSINGLQTTLQQQGSEIEQCLLDLETDINKERERSDQAGALRAGLQKISQVMHQHENNIAVHNYSTEMIQRVASKSIDNFNQSMTIFAERVLPYFTDHHYSQLKINDDLSVEIFSDKKNNYMSYDEISSGTQRQIMLALRMGMSEQLAKNTGNNKQFIFLDEPFAFFDHQRTLSTLEALPNVSDTITQVWVTSQDFPTKWSSNT